MSSTSELKFCIYLSTIVEIVGCVSITISVWKYSLNKAGSAVMAFARILGTSWDKHSSSTLYQSSEIKWKFSNESD